MVKGKPWSVEEEKQLKNLIEAKSSLPVIAEKLHKPEEAMRQKIRRLRLEVVEQDRSVCSTTSLVLPKELPSVEEALKMLQTWMEKSFSGSVNNGESISFYWKVYPFI